MTVRHTSMCTLATAKINKSFKRSMANILLTPLHVSVIKAKKSFLFCSLNLVSSEMETPVQPGVRVTKSRGSFPSRALLMTRK